MFDESFVVYAITYEHTNLLMRYSISR